MTRIFALTILVLCVALPVSAQMSLDSDVCYVQYRVTIKADHTTAGKALSEGRTIVTKYESVWENTVKLDMRSPGQTLSMLTGNQLDPAKLQKMSPAEQLKFSQDMLNAMQYSANWMQGAPEGLDGGDAMLAHMQSVSVPVRVSFQQTTTGSDLVSEMGSHFDMFEQTTLSYAGTGYTSPDQVKFEMNSSSKKYWLALPFNFKDMQNQGDALKFVRVSKDRPHGAAAWNPEETHTDETGVDVLGESFRCEANMNGQQFPTIEGTIDATGNISGEKSFPGHMDRLGPDVPVTLTYRYTVTKAPPAKAAGGK
jgi:hypothetical protein